MGCLDFLKTPIGKKLIEEIEKSMIKHSYIEKDLSPSLLVKPHGGNLINRFFEGWLSCDAAQIGPKQ